MNSDSSSRQGSQTAEKSHKSKNWKLHKHNMPKSSRIGIEENQVHHLRTWWDRSLGSECCSRCRLKKKRKLKEKRENSRKIKKSTKSQEMSKCGFRWKVGRHTKSNKPKSFADKKIGEKVDFEMARILSLILLFGFINPCTLLKLIKKFWLYA